MNTEINFAGIKMKNPVTLHLAHLVMVENLVNFLI